MIGAMAVVTIVIAKKNSPPFSAKPAGLVSLEEKTNRDFQDLLLNITARSNISQIETVPPLDPNAPIPSGTYLYNNLLENLLSGLHFYFPVSEETPTGVFVSSWDAETGERVQSEFMLGSLEYNVNYLLTLELYRKLHTKAVFDQDLEYARERVHNIFAQDWRTMAEWPLGAYFDLVELYDITGDETYMEYAERYALGNGPDDINTPFEKSLHLAFQFNLNFARMASPVNFFNAALLADYGNRHDDPELLRQANSLFTGLKNLLYDNRYKLLWKRASVPADNSSTVNLIQTFDTLEQVSAIRAISLYGRASGDPEAIGLAKTILNGIWGTEEGTSMLLIEPPPGWAATTYFGLHTAYDQDREAKRTDPNEITIVQILFYLANVLVNEDTKGEFRSSIDFLGGWLEDNGPPMYRRSGNGYLLNYVDLWQDPERPMVSTQASIWMTRALAEDEWYRYNVAETLIDTNEEL
jgi:hypothetical protein